MSGPTKLWRSRKELKRRSEAQSECLANGTKFLTSAILDGEFWYFCGQKYKETYFLLLFLTFGDEAFLAPGIVAPVNAATLSGFAFHSARDFMKK